MGLIKILAKVRIWSEKEYEDIQLADDTVKWKRKYISIHAGDIYRLIKYDSTKTILIDEEGEQIMVYEKYDDVHKKWEEGLKNNIDIPRTNSKEVEEEEENQEDENQEEEDD